MSISSHFVLVLLLCSSFYSCKARSLGVVAKQVQDSTYKENEKMNPDRVSKQQESKTSVQISSAFEEAKLEGRSKEKKIHDPRTDADTNGNQVEVSDASKTDHEYSRETVSWRLPHEKRDEQEVPGFNLDYLPPRTHPPAHN